jgi:hypothetical protein
METGANCGRDRIIEMHTMQNMTNKEVAKIEVDKRISEREVIV